MATPQEYPGDWRKDLRALRRQQGLSQTAVADAMGSKQSHVSEIETGDANPTISTLESCAKAIGCRLVIQFIPENEALEHQDDGFYSSTVLDYTNIRFRQVPPTGVAASLLALPAPTLLGAEHCACPNPCVAPSFCAVPVPGSGGRAKKVTENKYE